MMDKKEESQNMTDTLSTIQDGTQMNPAYLEETLDIEKLTNKKKEYLQDAIIDKNGAYSYLEDPQEYKKARKRLQNRESAVRSRQRKKNYQEVLEQKIAEQNEVIAEITQTNDRLTVENKQLAHENSSLKNQLAYFQDTHADSMLKGFSEESTDDDLDQKLADLLKKINHRFQNEQKNNSLSHKLNFDGEFCEKR